MQKVINSFSLRYDGNDASENIIDGLQLGQSLAGASMIYNATLHFCAFGVVPKGNYKKHASAYTAIPRAGCYEAIFIMGTAASQHSLLLELGKASLSKIFFSVLGALKNSWLTNNQKPVISDLCKSLTQMASDNSEVNKILANGLVQSNNDFSRLLEIKLTESFPELSKSCRPAARKLVAPIGKSCSTMSHKYDTEIVCEISEPEAYVIKSTHQEDLGDMEQYICESITEVNRTTGHCEMLIEGISGPIRGKITDPALELIGNIYTKSLDQKTRFSFSAKPVNRDGKLYSVYISDADELS